MHVLVTGAAGSIGRVVTTGLAADGHRVRALDRVARPDPPGSGRSDRPPDDWHTGDCLDPAAVDPAMTGVDAVVHLASEPAEADLPRCLASHVHTTARLLEAMLAHGVGRIVYASSNHAVGATPRSDLPGGLLTVDVPPRPDSFYGVAKVAAEGLLQRYADRHGLATYALRIGSFLDRPTSRRHLATWLSPADAVRLMSACLTAPAVAAPRTGTHRVVHGVSANTRGWWDLAPGFTLGYEPRDDAERYAADVPERADDHELAVVGGRFALPETDRPAFGPDGAPPRPGRP